MYEHGLVEVCGVRYEWFINLADEVEIRQNGKVKWIGVFDGLFLNDFKGKIPPEVGDAIEEDLNL